MVDGKHVGFTGSRNGMTEAQKLRVTRILSSVRGYLHHGDCIGSDKHAHDIAKACGLLVTTHPPTEQRFRAFCQADIEMPVQSYINRNHAIVDAADGLIATPSGYTEELRSGTWATVRYARKTNKPRVIVWPDGTVRNEVASHD